jgi:hypothetical protein
MPLLDEPRPVEELEAERAEEALVHCVVPRVSRPAHASPDAERLELAEKLRPAVDAAAIALDSTEMLRLASWPVDMAQPTTRREKRSIASATYSHPAVVRGHFTSVTQARFGSSLRKFRVSRFGAIRGPSQVFGTVRSGFFRQAIGPLSRLSLATRPRPIRMPRDAGHNPLAWPKRGSRRGRPASRGTGR